jgi:hypothetical protein
MAHPASPMVGGTNLTDHSPEAGTTTGLPGCPLAALLDSEPAEQTASRDTARNATRPKDRNTPRTVYKPTHDRLDSNRAARQRGCQARCVRMFRGRRSATALYRPDARVRADPKVGLDSVGRSRGLVVSNRQKGHQKALNVETPEVPQ